MNKLKVQPELFQEFAKLRRSYIDENGLEVPNPRPNEVSVGLRPPSLMEQIQRLVRINLSQEMQKQGAETFDEADDFDIPEDEDPISPYVVKDMEEDAPPNTFSSDHSQEAGGSSHAGPASEPDVPIGDTPAPE